MTRLLVLLALAGATFCARGQALPAPEIAARNYVLVDMSAHQVLAEHDADAAVDPGSLTKLMTAYLVLVALRDQKLTPQQLVPVSARALAEDKRGGPLIFLDDGAAPTVAQALQGLEVVSGDDAAVALAEAVGGSVEAFVGMMNRQAQAWGLKNTSFRNPTGAPVPGHRSTARDLAVIAQHVVRDFPDAYRDYAQRSFEFNHVRQDNPNLLLGRDPSVDGLKVAYTDSSGWSEAASARREFPNGPRRLLCVVLGTDSLQARAAESQKLLNWGFTAYDDIRLVAAGKPVATVPVWQGAARSVGIGSADDVYVAVPKGEGAELKTRIEHTDPLVAPLAPGQRVGMLRVNSASGTAIAAIPLTVLEPVPQAGFLGRAWDALRLWIK